MIDWPDIDPYGADSRHALADILAGPLTAGFRLETHPLDENGKLRLTGLLPSTGLLVRLRTDLGTDGLVVVPKLGTTNASALSFESHSQRGTALLLRAGAIAPGNPANLTIVLSVYRGGSKLDPADLADLFAIDLLDGNFGSLLTVLSFEHQRIRRHLRTIAHARTLEGARAASLDRVGAELGVPRFDNHVTFSGDEMRLNADPGDAESDEDYRARLAIYRRWHFPTPEAVLERLHAIHPAFELEEAPHPFENAFRLVSVGANAAEATRLRAEGLKNLRERYLVDLAAGPPQRPVSSGERQADRALYDRLRAGLSAIAPATPLSTGLLHALDRLVELKAASGYTGKIGILARPVDASVPQDDLGLGVRLSVEEDFATVLLESALTAPSPAALLANVVAAYRSMAPHPRGSLGLAQVLAPLGFVTATVLGPGEIYVSHLPIGGVGIEGPSEIGVAGGVASATYTVKDYAPATPAQLAATMRSVADSVGLPARLVPANRLADLLSDLPGAAPNLPARLVADQLSLEDQAVVVAGDNTSAAAMIMDGNALQLLRADDPATWDCVSAFAFGLADLGVPALAVLLTANGEVALLASSIPLPRLGANLTQRKSMSFRWATYPLDAVMSANSNAGNRAGGQGQRQFVFNPAEPGLWCVALTIYRRQGRTDPMEVRPVLPAGVTIDYSQYERMMNVLQAACPAGVEINTWRIRRRHVRLDPNGPARPLNVSAARSYRRYRQPRFALADVGNKGDGNV